MLPTVCSPASPITHCLTAFSPITFVSPLALQCLDLLILVNHSLFRIAVMAIFHFELPDLSDDEEWIEVIPSIQGLELYSIWHYPELRIHLLDQKVWIMENGQQITEESRFSYYEDMRTCPWRLPLVKIADRKVSLNNN